MITRRRVLLFLYSTPNIVGSLLGILGLLLFFTGLIEQFWFFIVVGLYAIGVLATPQNPTYPRPDLVVAEQRGQRRSDAVQRARELDLL